MKLHTEIKQLIIDTLNLEGLTPGDIDAEAPLFNEGLGLDSIDALELGLALKKKYNIVISSESSEARKYFSSVARLAELVSMHQGRA
jgi:acyl carrier protein